VADAPSAGALVTGATGFVGSHLVETLVARGTRVRCLARARSDRRWLPSSVEVATGSLDDPATLARAVAGVEVVYHLAALTSARRPADYDETNHRGVVRLLEVMAAHAPRARLVFCSSLAAAGPARAGRPLTEADPPGPVGPYGVSKSRAEAAVAAANRDAVIVRPPAVYGPRDKDVLVAFRLAAHGVAIRTGPARQQLAFIHVRDLARGLIRAGETPGAAGVYFVNGGNHSWEELIAAIGRAVGRQPTVVPLPAGVVRTAGFLAGSWTRYIGGRPFLTRERAWDLLQPNWTCDDTRARTELAYRPTVTLEDGMRETAAWYRAQGWLKG
jgi:dihydroflavonol-4-reductase